MDNLINRRPIKIKLSTGEEIELLSFEVVKTEMLVIRTKHPINKGDFLFIEICKKEHIETMQFPEKGEDYFDLFLRNNLELIKNELEKISCNRF